MITNKRDSFRNLSPAETASAKRVARNTWRYFRADGFECVRLHGTDVCATKGKTVILNSGGWRTVTTKDRMNYGPARVFSDKGKWVVSFDGKTAPFFDGMRLPHDLNSVKSKRAQKQEERALARMNKFLGKIKALAVLPEPEAGDCFICRFVTKAGSKAGTCIHDHIREGYIHGSLFVAAMRWAGYRDMGIRLYFDGFNRGDKWHRKVILSAMRRYTKAQLGIGAL